MPKEIPIFLEPTIFKLLLNNKLKICYYKEFKDIFFLGFTRAGVTLEIPIKVLKEIIKTLEEIRECSTNQDGGNT